MLRQEGGILIKIMTVILILIILLLVGGGAYLYFTFKPLIAEMKFGQKTAATNIAEVVDKHQLLNSSQEKALEFIGVDPAKLPTTVTPALEACATTELGAERVAELKKGALPGISDFLKAKGCLQQ